jgi:O-acetyl-ADP-ribose deacetylase (regulator of RNase III)
MININKGNILESKAVALINTVNTKGVMGKGIALQFKQSFPEMFKEYEHECEKGNIVIGKMHVWKNDAMFGPAYIINFPTKNDWKQPSKLDYIIDGLIDLVKVIKENNIASVAIPPLGCGNGGLDWGIVKEKIIDALKNIPDVRIELYEPNEDFILKPKIEVVEMTPSRALVLQIFKQYCVLGYELTLLEVHKLCYFLQEFGEPLRLRFQKDVYGPYADNIRHVLIKFEGTYTQGFRDGTFNKPDQKIRLLPRAIKESDEYIELRKLEMSDSLNRLAKVRKLIEGFESPFGLELLSTVYWIIKHDNVDIENTDDVVKAVHSWNSRKKKIMNPEHIKIALKRISEFYNKDKT